jgi:hypothetical protein
VTPSGRALCLVALVAAACSVDEEAFQERVFSCDTAAPDPLCGTDSDGNKMTCFAARQLGGSDFCVQTCGQPMSLPAEDAMCVQGGAKLKACNPTEDPMVGCGRPELGCLRTDVTSDEGVCITMNPCSDDTNCRDFVRSTCATTFLKQLYKGKPDLAADHLYCLQEGCIANNAACSPGETCLKTVIPKAANPPDICVPNCDSNLQCPPNHFCYRKISGPANPAVCIPGLLGFVCGSDVDCLVGKCRSDNAGDPTQGPGLNLCTISCSRDDECQAFDSEQGRFVCAPDGRCVTPEAYRGATCNTTADCVRDPGTICVRFPPDTSSDPDTGTCLRPCDADFTCPPRGEIGHACLPFPTDDNDMPTPVCFPGYFGSPCFDRSACAVPELQCAGADLSDPANPKPGACTIVCTSDSDCQQNRWTAGSSYCGSPALPVCLPLRDDGTACDADNQCSSKHCEKNAMGAMTCGGK